MRLTMDCRFQVTLQLMNTVEELWTTPRAHKKMLASLGVTAGRCTESASTPPNPLWKTFVRNPRNKPCAQKQGNCQKTKAGGAAKPGSNAAAASKTGRPLISAPAAR
jgi:hypothetical protein